MHKRDSSAEKSSAMACRMPTIWLDLAFCHNLLRGCLGDISGRELEEPPSTEYCCPQCRSKFHHLGNKRTRWLPSLEKRIALCKAAKIRIKSILSSPAKPAHGRTTVV